MSMLTHRRLILLAITGISMLLCAGIPAMAQPVDPMEMVRVERTLSTAHALPGSTFSVRVVIKALQDLDGVGIRETLPLGWAVHPVNAAGAAFKRSENEWVFTDRLTAGTTAELLYEVTVPAADHLYAETLPTCFEITGIFQATVPGFDIPIPGDTVLAVSTALPIPTVIAHLIPGDRDSEDTVDLRVDQYITGRQLDRALEYWSTDTIVPWTEGEIIELPMIEKLTAMYETCTQSDELLPLSIDPALLAIRRIDTFLPCDSVLLPKSGLDPGLPARQLSITVEISGSHDAYGIGLAELFPETWLVTPVEHPGFVYRPSATEWIYPDRLPVGQTITVHYVVEVRATSIEQLGTYDGCCGAPAPFVGIASSGLECSEAEVGGESEAFVWRCLPVLLAISRWDVAEDQLDATLSDAISFPQLQRAIGFWLSSSPVPHTCGYTVGYHMLKRIVAYWLSAVPVTKPLPGVVASSCEPPAGCYTPFCPTGGLCHMLQLQREEDYVGVPNFLE